MKSFMNVSLVTYRVVDPFVCSLTYCAIACRRCVFPSPVPP